MALLETKRRHLTMVSCTKTPIIHVFSILVPMPWSHSWSADALNTVKEIE